MHSRVTCLLNMKQVYAQNWRAPVLRDSTFVCPSSVHRTLQRDSQATRGGGAPADTLLGAYRLWPRVCRHTSTRCRKTSGILQLRCATSRYTCQSFLSCFNTCLWPEPPGGASYKVSHCGQEGTPQFLPCRCIRTRWLRTLIHRQAPCLCISSRIVEPCLHRPQEGLQRGEIGTRTQ